MLKVGQLRIAREQSGSMVRHRRRGLPTSRRKLIAVNREIAAIIAASGFRQRMAAIGVDVVGSTPAAYAKFISDDFAKWGKVVAAAGIKPE